MVSYMIRILTVLTLSLILSACQTLRGSGPLTLTEPVQQSVDRLMNQMSTHYIAVSVDGATVGASYCPDGVSAQCQGDGAAIAIRSCEWRARGKKCYLYANGSAVIWDFDGPAPAGAGAPVSANRLVMHWDASGKKLEAVLEWKEPARTEAAFRVDDDETGLRNCTGMIVLKSKTIRLKCESGKALYGYVSFKGNELNGSMLDSERRLIKVQVI
jgi:hypothetical protein